MRAHTRITATINPELAKKFSELTRKIGVSGTALLSRTLPGELKYLAEIPSNSERARTAYHLGEKLTRDDADVHPMKRLNVTLDRQDAENMSQLCAAKGVPRDRFIGCYVEFLVNGDDEVCEGPLAKVSEILAHPRYEYEQKKKNRTKGFQENPYSSLHLTEEIVDMVSQFMKEKGEKR